MPPPTTPAWAGPGICSGSWCSCWWPGARCGGTTSARSSSPPTPRAWGWLHRTLRLPEEELLLLYRGFAFYGLGRMISWFLYARFGARAPLDLSWNGPYWVEGNDLSDAGVVEVAVRTTVGGVLFAGFLWLCWRLFVRRLWDRAVDPPAVSRGTGLGAVFGASPSRDVSEGEG